MCYSGNAVVALYGYGSFYVLGLRIRGGVDWIRVLSKGYDGSNLCSKDHPCWC